MQTSLPVITIRSVAFPLALMAALILPVSASYAAPITFFAFLDGASESPPNGSPATGTATVVIDGFQMNVSANFSGLLGNTTAAHIHCCTLVPGEGTAGVATQTPSFIGFPLGVTAGTFNNTFDMTLASSYRAGFITDNGGTTALAFAALLAGMHEGEAYFNIHSTLFPGGEIRGFLTETPLPAALPLFATGLGVMALLSWRRKRKSAALAAA